MTGTSAKMMPETGAYPEAGVPEVIDGNGQYVAFTCAEKRYGIDIMSVREIRSWTATTELPEQPHAACGVLDIRGEIVQVFDLNVMLGGARTEATSGHVVLVVSMRGRTVGILADSVSDIIHVGKEDMRPVPSSGQHENGLLSGIAKHEDQIVAILDLSVILGGST